MTIEHLLLIIAAIIAGAAIFLLLRNFFRRIDIDIRVDKKGNLIVTEDCAWQLMQNAEMHNGFIRITILKSQL